MARFNIDFSDDAAAVLEELSDRLHSSKAEVLRRALALEKWFEDTQREGAKIIIEKDGRQRELLRIA